MVCGWALTASAAASGLQVSPISMEIPAGLQSQNLWLSNSGEQPMRVQVRVMRWQQEGGVDTLVPTRDLLASPPVIALDPASRQMLRIVRLDKQAPVAEQAYRLIVDELPPDEKTLTEQLATSQNQAKGGLQFVLRYSIPVFVLPDGAPESLQRAEAVDLAHMQAWLARDAAAGQLALHVRNQGPQRLRMSQITYVSPDGRVHELVSGLLGYVLTGQQMRWDLPLPDGVSVDEVWRTQAGQGHLTVHFNQDGKAQTLPLQPPAP